MTEDIGNFDEVHGERSCSFFDIIIFYEIIKPIFISLSRNDLYFNAYANYSFEILYGGFYHLISVNYKDTFIGNICIEPVQNGVNYNYNYYNACTNMYNEDDSNYNNKYTIKIAYNRGHLFGEHVYRIDFNNLSSAKEVITRDVYEWWNKIRFCLNLI